MRKILLKRNPKLTKECINDNLTLFYLEEGKIITLNETAALIWKALWRPKSKKEVINDIYRKYPKDKKKLKTDLNGFFKKAVQEKILLKI